MILTRPELQGIKDKARANRMDYACVEALLSEIVIRIAILHKLYRLPPETCDDYPNKQARIEYQLGKIKQRMKLIAQRKATSCDFPLNWKDPFEGLPNKPVVL